MSRYSSMDLSSVEDRIAELRRKVESLMSEQVSPAVSRASGRAQNLAHQASDVTRREAEQVFGLVRERPVVTIAVAVGVGFLIAKLLRR
ncbi:hypothetical protein [Teichococcus vastitatis]|jgi:ElaB/YqjD/DUF883 family membrane-anchored ribosome-binding protein|uniref:Membrane-anchored ribosome-binding protein, inhibits growth in stationary phase, ElaB/YqjD/DUF883 family n=1 Tax=Teichococcus vastitatis TaxID=2307076 RepID=A0ABS9WDR8_9PROT|nr:hypothetical protein [Pseudoroseomonas vastitatis]MCI0756885.1 hypothetical protein [Pseudoroseomonas vastitatis]